MNEYLVSGGVAYEVATYGNSTWIVDDPTPSLTGLTAVSPAPTQASGSLSGLCKVSANYLGFNSAVETLTSYGFITVSSGSDASLESACNTFIQDQLWYDQYYSGLDNGSNYNPVETLTDLKSNAVLVNGAVFVPTGDTLTGLCKWNITGEYGIYVGEETLWGTSDSSLETQCYNYYWPAYMNASGGTGVVANSGGWSLVDQTTGVTLISTSL